MVNRALRVAITLSMSLYTIVSYTTAITLDSSLIRHVDGIFINGRRICDIRKLQLEIGFLAVGKKTKEGLREPLYIFHVIEHDDVVYVICSDGTRFELHEIVPGQTHSKSTAVYDSATFYECASLFSHPLYHVIYDPQLSPACVQSTLIELDQERFIDYLLATTTQRHSLHSLMLLEQELNAKNNDTHARMIMRTALVIMLTFMKHDFEKKASKFIEEATMFKKAMVELIQESCTKRGRPDSLLLGWAKSEKGHEMEHFNEHVLNFKDFYIFSGDLITFLSDLMHSCPKAMKQFKELMEQTPEKG